MIRVSALEVVSQADARRKPPTTLSACGMLSAFLAVVLLCLGMVVPTNAQLYAGSVTGTVRDSSGAVIPTASVTLMDEEKGFSFTGTTLADGLSGGRTIYRAMDRYGIFFVPIRRGSGNAPLVSDRLVCSDRGVCPQRESEHR